jgi:hypothetical protein
MVRRLILFAAAVLAPVGLAQVEIEVWYSLGQAFGAPEFEQMA